MRSCYGSVGSASRGEVPTTHWDELPLVKAA